MTDGVVVTHQRLGGDDAEEAVVAPAETATTRDGDDDDDDDAPRGEEEGTRAPSLVIAIPYREDGSGERGQQLSRLLARLATMFASRRRRRVAVVVVVATQSRDGRRFNRGQVRLISQHWSPYDRVGVVNAVP